MVTRQGGECVPRALDGIRDGQTREQSSKCLTTSPKQSEQTQVRRPLVVSYADLLVVLLQMDSREPCMKGLGI